MLKKRFIKIIILKYKVINDFLIYKTFYDLFFRDNYYIKLIIRYSVYLRLNKLISRASLRLLYAVSS